MSPSKRPINQHELYHAHIYFDADSRDLAAQLCHQIRQELELPVGRFHEKLVGPHPRWSCQISFTQADFDHFIPWLEQHRQGLTVFVHGVTGDYWQEHTTYAYWLGDSVPLNLPTDGSGKSAFRPVSDT